MTGRGDSASERGLRAAALAGDAAAWRGLFDPAFDTVAGYARWRCGGRTDLADDVIQEAWLTAARKLASFNPAESAFAGWVCGIAANVARAQVRRRRREVRRVRPLVAVPEPVSGERDDAADAERVALALAELPEKYEAALRLKYLERLGVSVIAAASGASVKATESLLTRARQAFREAYARLGGEHP